MLHLMRMAPGIVALVFMSILPSSPANAQASPSQSAARAAKPLPPFRSEDYRAFVMGVDNSLRVRNFEVLELQYENQIASRYRATDGSWLLEEFTKAFETYFKEADDAQIEQMFARWKEKSPNSRLRPVAYALMWETTAWKARGSGYASELTPEMADEFERRLHLAQQALDESKDVGADSPLWHYVSLAVAGSLGMTNGEVDRRFETAANLFPTYRPLYYVRMNFLLPQWGGSFERVAEFIDASQKRTASTDGKAFYAWLYTKLAKSQCCTDTFTEAGANWPRLRDAYEEAMVRFPDTNTLVYYATMACLAEDGPTSARLMEQVLSKKIRLDIATDGMVSNSICNGVAKRPTSKHG